VVCKKQHKKAFEVVVKICKLKIKNF